MMIPSEQKLFKIQNTEMITLKFKIWKKNQVNPRYGKENT